MILPIIPPVASACRISSSEKCCLSCIYLSTDGKKVDSVPNRDCLFSGQTPESFLPAKYVNFRRDISDERIALIHAGTEFALMNGLTVRVYPGDTHNYKITTAHDLETFRIQTLNEN